MLCGFQAMCKMCATWEGGQLDAVVLCLPSKSTLLIVTAAVSVGDYVALYTMKSHAVMVEFLLPKSPGHRWFLGGHTCEPSCNRMYGV